MIDTTGVRDDILRFALFMEVNLRKSEILYQFEFIDLMLILKEKQKELKDLIKNINSESDIRNIQSLYSEIANIYMIISKKLSKKE